MHGVFFITTIYSTANATMRCHRSKSASSAPSRRLSTFVRFPSRAEPISAKDREQEYGLSTAHGCFSGMELSLSQPSWVALNLCRAASNRNLRTPTTDVAVHDGLLEPGRSLLCVYILDRDLYGRICYPPKGYPARSAFCYPPDTRVRLSATPKR